MNQSGMKRSWVPAKPTVQFAMFKRVRIKAIALLLTLLLGLHDFASGS
jgi:hypothetical protein